MPHETIHLKARIPDRVDEPALEALQALQYTLEDNTRRLVRMETRLCKLMMASGLDREGNTK